MVNVRIDKKIIFNHENYICNSEIENTIKALKDNEMINKLKDIFGHMEITEHLKFCDFILEQLESLKRHERNNIFVGDIDNLVEIIQYVNERFPLVCGLIDNDKKIKCGNKEYMYWELIFFAFGYNKFSDHGISRAQSEDNPEAVYIYNYDKDQAVNEWGAYAYVLSLGLKVCPYCNRNYIAPIYSENGKVRADLDHFFPKSKYPYLSVSLYILVSTFICHFS